MRAWGFNIVRLSVTWDALEHKGPKQYDTDYVQYVLDVVKACRTFGLYVYVDPHQDVWSRHCGGSGAPAWTLEKVGLDHSKFKETCAAVTHHDCSEEDPTQFPRMFWPTNMSRLACLTMFTVFFGRTGAG